MLISEQSFPHLQAAHDARLEQELERQRVAAGATRGARRASDASPCMVAAVRASGCRGPGCRAGVRSLAGPPGWRRVLPREM